MTHLSFRRAQCSAPLAALASAGGALAQCTPLEVQPIPGGANGEYFGHSVALTPDGATALIGGSSEGNLPSRVAVWVRSGGGYTQQQNLPHPGSVVDNFGQSVALSSDGNTAVVGAPQDSSFTGGVYVFTRAGTVWTQQGPKLVPAGAAANGSFGFAVALSADGNTALLGHPGDTGGGSVHVYTRAGGVWTQQGPKLTPIGAGGAYGQGVALSADGSTALVCSQTEGGGAGAVYAYSRNGGAWSLQGPRILPPANVSGFGEAVSISPDGGSAIVGAGTYNTSSAAVICTRNGGTWITGAVLSAGLPAGMGFGRTVVLSSDAATALIGAPGNDSAFLARRDGATWTLGPQLTSVDPTQSGSHHFGESLALTSESATALFGTPYTSSNFSLPPAGGADVFAIHASPTFTQQPINAASAPGGSAGFTISVSSADAPSFQWRQNGVNMNNGPTGTGAVVSGATTPALTISALTTAENGGAYDCVVTIPCAMVRSNPAGLAVTSPCYPNCDGSTQVPVLNVADFSCFLQKYSAGCP